MTDNQFEQLFGMMTKTVSGVQELNERVGKLGQKVDELQQGQTELRQGQDEMRAEFTEFREETRENFDKLNREKQVETRKVKMLNNDALETKAKVEDLIERVEKIEEKQAA